MNVDGKVYTNGNSFLNQNNFSPLHMMIARTFSIEVYERKYGTDGSGVSSTPIYTIHHARLTSYSMSFTPSSLIQENVGFIAMRMEDAAATI
jgi:hypothetical protein